MTCSARADDPAPAAAPAPGLESPDDAAPAEENPVEAAPSAGGEKPSVAPGPAAPAATDVLVLKQTNVADSYARFKIQLLKLAEVMRATDPVRADLLEKAAQQVSANGTDDQLKSILKLLDSDLVRDLDQAVDRQSDVQTELSALLKLLLSENRDRRNASEKDRVRGYIKDIEHALKIQRAIQGQTERSGQTEELADRQGKLAGRTDDIAKKIAAEEESHKTPADDKKKAPPAGDKSAPDGGKPSDGSPEQGKPGQPGAGDKSGKESKSDKNGPKNDKPGDKKDGDKKDADKKDGAKKDPGKPEPGKDGAAPSDGSDPAEKGSDPGMKPGGADGAKPSAGKAKKPGMPGGDPSEDPKEDPKEDKPPAGEKQPDADQPEDQSNGRKQLEKAVEKMRQAKQRLEEAKRGDAVKEQEAAVASLEKAKAELEEILRQLRQEEVEKTLVQLEARFRNMLKLQQAVYDGTQLLDKKPAAQRDRADEIEASRLARREQAIVTEVDKALLLLREDGSAVAFPEAISQLREDMGLIAERLNVAKIGSATQRIELDVIESLQEMIAALEKAQQDMKQKQSQAQQPGEPSDPPLVDAISELKMIRALQVRVNRRTTQYEEMIRSGESTAKELLPRQRQLAESEQKIHRITRDLHLGKNK
ncbi:MAG: hypothetical protein K8T25_15015 [Planctomycetia bacterium]|nr:hypothetical protein [Planctomycetia bacterium]